ncbi:MAG: hypothetical protein WA884_08975, partial [Methyloceanibacter sp.]
LAGVATMPFSTTLLAEFISYRTAMLIYWVNLLLLGLTLYWSWRWRPPAAPRPDRRASAAARARRSPAG